MLKTKLKLFTAIAVSILTTGAFAFGANSGSRQSFQDGFYAGASVGMGHMHNGSQDSTVDFTPDTTADGELYPSKGGSLSSTRLSGDLFAGYFYNIEGTDFAIALEPYFGVTPVKHAQEKTYLDVDGVGSDLTLRQKFRQKWHLGVPVKFGMFVFEDYFVYLVTGLELGRFKFSETLVGNDNGSDQATSKAKTMAGIAYGLGVETELDPIRVGLEVKNVSYGKKTFKNEYRDGTLESDNTMRVRPNVLNIALKASYLF